MVSPLMPDPAGQAARALALLERRDIALHDVRWFAEVGSKAHGISVGDDDDDYTAVRMEPWAELVNYDSKRQSLQIRTQPDGHRSRLGDIDVNVYTLRKFCALAAKGNPSILTVLFSPPLRDLSFPVDQIAGYAAARSAGAAFAGYLRQQLERWQGKRGQKNVNRPELVERYGFDTKYAGHALRLCLQGIEFLETGRVSVPMPESDAALVRKLREGGYSEKDALELVVVQERHLRTTWAKSKLPERANTTGMRRLLSREYADWYDCGLADV